MVICNFNGTLMDKNIWGDPDVFRPERFIDAQGSIFIPDQYTPFGFGKFLPSNGGNYLTCVPYFKEECCIMSRYHLLLCDAILIGRWVPILQTTLLPQYCHFYTLKLEATGLPKRWYPSTSQHHSTSQKISNLVRNLHFKNLVPERYILCQQVSTAAWERHWPSPTCFYSQHHSFRTSTSVSHQVHCPQPQMLLMVSHHHQNLFRHS